MGQKETPGTVPPFPAFGLRPGAEPGEEAEEAEAVLAPESSGQVARLGERLEGCSELETSIGI